MERRDLLKGAGLAGATCLSGCLSTDPLVAEAVFTYTPPNPTVGEDIVFDASKANASDCDWFFNKSPGMFVDETGTRVTHSFEEAGAHTVTLRASAPIGLIPGPNIDRATQVIYVGEQSNQSTVSNPISVSTDQISLHLRGVRTRVTIEEEAVLQFSATNLNADTDLSVRLVLIPPSGVDVQATSSVGSGNSQYSSSMTIPPGETAGISIRIKGNRTGKFEIRGIADFAFEDGTERTQQGVIPIIVTPEE